MDAIWLRSDRNGFSPAVDVKLHQHIANMRPHCVWRDLKKLSDGVVAKALAQEAENNLFAIG
jgi:hypothetical protein